MEERAREREVARLVAGSLPFVFGGEPYTLGTPGRAARLMAADLHEELLGEAYLAGLYSQAESLPLLMERGAWTNVDEEQYALLGEKLDEMRVGLYEGRSNQSGTEVTRRALARGKAELSRMESVRGSLYPLTAEGVAAMGRLRFLAGCALRLPDGSMAWPEPLRGWRGGGWSREIEAAMEESARRRLDLGGLRELARSEPWQSIWSASKSTGGGPFGTAAADLTDEQLVLVRWSQAYDAIRGPEGPGDDVIEDDDMLDGWMILQKKVRDEESARRSADELIANPKIRGAQEVYVFPQLVDDAASVHKFNDPAARSVKAQRMDHLRKMSQVGEMDMPDTKLRFQMAMNQHAARGIKG